MFDLQQIDFVIPVYNALQFTQKCLETLDAHYPERNLILVNDGSDSETTNWLIQYAEAHEPQSKTRMIHRSARGWFTRAINTGLRAAGCMEPKETANENKRDWLIALNTDCEIGEGAFETMFETWDIAARETRRPVGLVGCEGPRERATHPRWAAKWEPGYVTGHALLFKKAILRWERLRFPQDDNEVKGFSAQSLLHINSDRALSYEFNRRTYMTVADYWAAVGHHGGKSWGYNMAQAMSTNVFSLVEE